MNRDSREILDSIRQIVRALRLSAKSVERSSKISSAQLFVLQKLKEGEAVSINELATRTLTHQSSVSVVVSKLAKQGLVQRRRAKMDKRGLEISIAPAGLAVLKKSPEPFQDQLIGAIEKLPADQRRQLALGLKKIIEATDLPEGPVPLFFEEKTKRGK